MSDRTEDARAFDRRDFLKTAGVVVVAFSLARKLDAQTAAQRGIASGPPDPRQVDSYFAINADNTATLYTGYVELGQGGPTALRQIAAEELDLDFEQVNTAPVDTFVSTAGFTAAGRTGAIGGTETRAAAAEARRVLVELAAQRLGAPAERLTVARGVVSVRGNSSLTVTYAELVAAQGFQKQFEQVAYNGGIELPRKEPNNAIPKARDAYRIVGTRVQRPDIAGKIRGTYRYVHQTQLPGMLYGRVILPRGQGASGISRPTIRQVDEASIADIPGARVVRRNNLVGVVAEREWDAVRAARQLNVTWEPFVAALPGHDALFEAYKAAKTNDLIDTDTGDVDGVFSQSAHQVAASYAGPYQSHGAMAPNCAVADVKADSALVVCSHQGIFLARNGLAQLLRLPIEKIRVQFQPGSNTYGSSCYTEAAHAAAILSQESGKPVRLQLTREDELGWDNYGPALLSELRGAADANGKLTALDYQAWVRTAGGFDTISQLALDTPTVGAIGAGAGGLAGFGAPGPGGAGLFSVYLAQTEMYDVPNRRIVNRRVTDPGYLRTGALRSPMDPSAFFALEGLMDELAHTAKLDPYEFRKRNISHPRWLAVLEAATNAARWRSRVSASERSSQRVVPGRGIGIGTHHLPQNQGNRVTFAAAIADIEVDTQTGVVVAKHIFGAMDCGLAINPAIVESQMVGMAVHGASLALREEVQFDETCVTSVDWATYQTLRFAEHPNVTPILLQRLNEQSTGAGEELLPAVTAAIGNAFFDATGVRLRRYPLTPQRVLAALTASRSA